MQPSAITLPVDVLNNGTTENQVFTRFDAFQNRSVYNGPDHSLTSNDQLYFYRSTIKSAGNFAGTAKTRAKFTKDFSVPGVDSTTTLKAPAISEHAFSFPVGMTRAEKIEFIQRSVALLDTADVIGDLVDEMSI